MFPTQVNFSSAQFLAIPSKFTQFLEIRAQCCTIPRDSAQFRAISNNFAQFEHDSPHVHTILRNSYWKFIIVLIIAYLNIEMFSMS